MIAARAVRLVRTPSLRATQRAIAALATSTSADTASLPLAATRRLIVVPTRAAASSLRETIERLCLVEQWVPGEALAAALGVQAAPRGALAMPVFATRAEVAERVVDESCVARQRLDGFTREALMRAAASAADAAHTPAPFRLRPGLIAEMVHFYDAIRRRLRSVDDFARLTLAQLEDQADLDRGAARLLAQTHFLVAAFERFESLTRTSGGVDEHVARVELAAGDRPFPWTHVIIACADRDAEPGGLWPADFDLFARASGLDRIDVVATDRLLDSGWRERLEARLPGLVEVQFAPTDEPPVVLTPVHDDALHWTVRDRENELEFVAARAKLDAVDGRRSPHGTAIVVQRPLPYVYLARHVFGQAGVPWTATDALPLAAEPFATAVDLVLACLFGDFARDDVVALVASPLFDFGCGAIEPRDAQALAESLEQAQYFADRERLGELLQSFVDEAADSRTTTRRRALGGRRNAARAAGLVARALPELDPPRRMSEYLSAIIDVLERHTMPATTATPERHARARRTVLDALVGMRDAARAHDDPAWPFRDVAAVVRRWIESQTFSPRVGRDGVRLLDATSARFADVEALWIAGLTEGEWPAAESRVSFYPSELLTDLGWPSERTRLLADRAAFDDLVRSPRNEVGLLSIAIEDDAVVRPSMYLDDLDLSDLRLARIPTIDGARVSFDEAAWRGPARPDLLEAEPASWLHWRMEQPAHESPEFHGCVGPTVPARFTVTALETYLECPFKYFARHLLRLDEPDDVFDGLSPRESGRILHDVLDRFMRRWDDARRAGPLTIDDARAMFSDEADAVLASLAERDRTIERTRLVGSALAVGAGERVIGLEFDDGSADPVARRLEWAFERFIHVVTGDRSRAVRLRGTIDRVDVFADETFRVIDYKRGNTAPSASKALQLPLYAMAVEQDANETGAALRVGEAMYMALGPRGGISRAIVRGRRDEALEAASRRLVDAVEGVERGEFPPRPREIHQCTRCGFSLVCRKDYVPDNALPTD